MKIDIDAEVSTITPQNLHNLGGYVGQYTCTGAANSGKTLTINTQGEYIIAVDYRVKAGSSDTEEVLAKVRVEGSETRSSQVMFSPLLRQFVPIANHAQDNWTEYFIWPEGEIVHYTQTLTRDSTSTLETSVSRLYWRQLLYALDLRAGLYAYSFWDDEHNSTISLGAGGLVIQSAGTFKEGGEIVAGARPKIPIFGPTANTYTSNRPTTPGRLAQGAIICTNGTVTDTSYGVLDFSFSWRGDPLFLAVDSNQNIAASFDYRNFNNDRKHFNFLSGGSLEQVIPGELPESRYEPLGVIR